mgnify:CR=1 FL=1
MRTLVKILFAFFGLGGQFLGVFFILDGLLALRSHGPRFSPIGIGLGMALSLAGWYIQRLGKRVAPSPPEAK